MKTWIIGVLCLLLVGDLTAQQDKNIVFDANAQVRKVSGFTAIEISGAIDLYLAQGNEDAVAVSASSDDIANHIRTELRDNVLKIYFENKGWNWKSWTNTKMKAYVTVANLKRLEVSGACNVRTTDILKANDLMVEMSGASDFFGQVSLQNLRMELSGACSVKMSGVAEKATIGLSGASSMKSYDLKVDYCKLDASGASDIRITINKELSARASGGSSINYRGEGLIRDISSGGASSIKHRSD